MNTKVAVLVLNRNMREMTEALIERIRSTTREVAIEIWNIDNGSDQEQIVRNADHDVLNAESKRWAHAFSTVLYQLASEKHDHFWCVCNDTQLVDDGVLDTLCREMPNDACQIHPCQLGHPRRQHDQGKYATGVRAISFVEFVCPLLNGNFVRECMRRFDMPGVSNGFPYGWGVDYEMPYLGHRLGMKSYICDDVGILHEPGTTHRHHEQTKVEPNEVMRKLARNTMLDVLEQRYGRNWGQIFADAAQNAGVDPKAFLDWSQYDRQMAISGARA